MEFIHYVLGGILDSIVLFILMSLLLFIPIINSKKLNAFVEKILTKIFSEEGLF